MGFWSTLMRVGGAIAAPFTGGLSLALTEGINAASSIAGGMADQSAENRASKGSDQFNRDALTIRGNEGYENAQQGRAKLLLDQQQGARTAESDAFRKALIARLTQGATDTSIDRSGFHANVPTIKINGGLRPSTLGDMRGQAGGALETAALARLRTPEARPALTPLEKPAVREAPEAPIWERLAGAAALAGTVAGKFGKKSPGQEADDVEKRIYR